MHNIKSLEKGHMIKRYMPQVKEIIKKYNIIQY